MSSGPTNPIPGPNTGPVFPSIEAVQSTDPLAVNRVLNQLRTAVEMMTGQRGDGEHNLVLGLTQSKKEVENARGFIRELRELVINGDMALAQRIDQIEVIFESGDLTELFARLTAVETARADGDSALAQRATTLEARATDLESGLSITSAAVIAVDQASVTRDEALAARTTNVEAVLYDPDTGLAETRANVIEAQQAIADETSARTLDSLSLTAKYNDISANAAVKITASATPLGAQAAYDVRLSAGDKWTGMKIMLNFDESTAIAFQSNNFWLYDPAFGTQRIFNYSAGRFSFNVPVEINGSLMVNGTLINNKLADNTISSMSSGQTIGFKLDKPVFCRNGAKMLVLAKIEAQYTVGNAVTAITSRRWQVKRNGTVIRTFTVFIITIQIGEGQSVTLRPEVLVAVPTDAHIGADTYVFTLEALDADIAAIELTILEISR